MFLELLLSCLHRGQYLKGREREGGEERGRGREGEGEKEREREGGRKRWKRERWVGVGMSIQSLGSRYTQQLSDVYMYATRSGYLNQIWLVCAGQVDKDACPAKRDPIPCHRAQSSTLHSQHSLRTIHHTLVDHPYHNWLILYSTALYTYEWQANVTPICSNAVGIVFSNYCIAITMPSDSPCTYRQKGGLPQQYATRVVGEPNSMCIAVTLV